MKTRSEIMKKGHEIAKTLEGDFIARLSEGLKQAWAMAKKVVIEKGNKYYKQAQHIANKLAMYAETDRWNNNSFFDIAFEEVSRVIDQVKETNHFAAKIANTVTEKMNPYNKKVAFISSKQAWIMACAMVENNISF